VRRRPIYTPRAREDLIAVRGWLTQPGSGQAAHKRLFNIRAAIRGLQQDPCQFPAGEHPGAREPSCDGGYRALYRVIPDTGRSETSGNVLVLRVYGPGQDRRAL
jgi:plasmid stabilization system protein ParE